MTLNFKDDKRNTENLTKDIWPSTSQLKERYIEAFMCHTSCSANWSQSPAQSFVSHGKPVGKVTFLTEIWHKVKVFNISITGWSQKILSFFSPTTIYASSILSTLVLELWHKNGFTFVDTTPVPVAVHTVCYSLFWQILLWPQTILT